MAEPRPLADGNRRLVEAAKLTRPRARRTSGEFLAEGPQAVREALNAPGVVREVFVTASAWRRDTELFAGAPETVALHEISDRAAARLGDTVTPQGVYAVCRMRHAGLDEVVTGAARLLVGLIEPNDPGNAGTILRTADAAGADGVVVLGGTDVYGGKCVRASAGSVFHLRIARPGSATEMLEAAGEAGLTVVATGGAARVTLDEIIDSGALARPTLWLFGTEAHGLPGEVMRRADVAVRVPIYGRAESLNLASAAAVCLYASARAQR